MYSKKCKAGLTCILIYYQWKKCSEATQTLRIGCSKAEPKFFAPPQTAFLGAQDGQNLISWRRSLPLPTNPVWWRSMHTISSYHGNRPTNTQIPKYTNAQTEAITNYNRLRHSLSHSVTSYFCFYLWKKDSDIHRLPCASNSQIKIQ